MTEEAVDTLRELSLPLLLHNAVWDWSLSNPEALSNPEVLRLTQKRLGLTRAPYLSIHLGYSATHVAFEKEGGLFPQA